MYPFFSFYGSRWRKAKHYAPPQHEHVIEPFAGGAGYSTFYEPERVTLIDVDPIVVGVWRYLIRVKPQEIMALRTDIEHVDALTGFPQEAKHLIGFWMNKALVAPTQQRSNWARQRLGFTWHERARARIAGQVGRIRHWKIIEGSYDRAPDIEAHWHVDAPYCNQAGDSYRFNHVNYARLAEWCKTRKGFRQVCEHNGATWLPFQPIGTTRGAGGKNRKRLHSGEAVWESGRRKGSFF
jgi:hypothetical protein